MIPKLIDETTKSHAEREVFERLRDDPTTNDWIVLHSLGIATHPHNVEGEADFVVISPGRGVLVLEVKGASTNNLRRDDDGLWFYAPGGRPDSRGPFRQANEAKHAIRNRLVGIAASKGVPFLSGVVFPNANFAVKSPEWHEWEFINSEQFRSRPIGELLRSMFNKGKAHLQSTDNAPYIGGGAPTREQCDQLAKLLRPSFDIPFDFGAVRKKNKEDTLRFTEEQFVALDNMDRNPRVIFTGPAGTGKTFLAMEAARRSAINGQRVLFLSFNAKLGRWIKEQFVSTDGDITATTIHSHMKNVIGGTSVPDDATSEYWEKTLPDMAVYKLLEGSSQNATNLLYDVLILDETQDILHEGFLDFLDLSLRGGLSAGKWRMFGDFDYQRVYEAQRLGLDQFMAERVPGSPIFGLTTNCRNSPEISQWAEMLASIVPGYSTVRRTSSGIDPVLRFYSTPDEQRSLLIEALQELHDLGYKGNDVVVLSSKKDRDSAAASINQSPWKYRLRSDLEDKSGHVAYCSIHSFKGLESEAVILTDIESIGQPRDKTLFYVALTRPLDQLFILAHERVSQQFLAELTRNKIGASD